MAIKSLKKPTIPSSDIPYILHPAMSASQPRAKQTSSSPRPRIQKTMVRYLQSIQPVPLADEHTSGPYFSTSYGRQQALLNGFLASSGPLAEAHFLTTQLARRYVWDEKDVLVWRAPLLIN
ncbi:hypothetical protein PAXINDRAFT_17304 [Paxillus involutus ATCC 200175]|uniref:Uncharacterized protein n=1 Tax=Paxillus involutus ATCC 200175 TaxID=664439 RepID=A0A0C9TPB1_PAXIN|nr:hypothetical protein PAXINDRAFT_17304 [Paxillus involutus ATCC 200175]